MGMTNSKQICFLIQVHTTGTFSGISPAQDLHSNILTKDMSGLTFTDALHISSVSFKHRKYQAMSLLKGQALGHWEQFLHSPLPLLFQEVGKVIALVHVICMFMFLIFQLVNCAAMALFCQQELFQHAPICLFLLFFKPVQLDCRKEEQTLLKVSLLTSSDLSTNNAVFGKCKSRNFMAWVLHKAVTSNKNNCPVKVMIYLDDILAINTCTVFRHTKDRTSLSFRVAILLQCRISPVLRCCADFLHFVGKRLQLRPQIMGA